MGLIDFKTNSNNGLIRFNNNDDSMLIETKNVSFGFSGDFKTPIVHFFCLNYRNFRFQTLVSKLQLILIWRVFRLISIRYIFIFRIGVFAF